MSDALTTTGGQDDPDDQRTHMERINDPAVPGYTAAPPPEPERGVRRLYRMLIKGLHNGRLYRPGEIVELWESEASPHHELVDPDEAANLAPGPVQQTYLPSAVPAPAPSVMPAEAVVPIEPLDPLRIDPQVVRLDAPADAGSVPRVGGEVTTETVTYADGTSATGPAPMPQVSPDGAVAVSGSPSPP